MLLAPRLGALAFLALIAASASAAGADSPHVWRLDFGTATSPVAEGYFQVTPDSPMLIAVDGWAMSELESPGVKEWNTRSRTVHVRDGHVDVTLLASRRPGAEPDPAAVINALTVEEIRLPPDPLAWSLGRGRALYRRATVAELVRNGWPIGTSLVVNRDLRVFDARSLRVFAPVGGGKGTSRRLANPLRTDRVRSRSAAASPAGSSIRSRSPAD